MPFRKISFIFSVALIAALTACGSGQRNLTLDSAPEDIAKVKNIAIASVTARPSASLELMPFQQGHIVRALTKFENEIFEYLLMRGFNVISPAVSRIAYTRETDYEDLYIANSSDILTNIQSGAEFKYLANNMKKLSMRHTQKPAGTFTSDAYEPSQYNLMPSTNRTPTINYGQPDIVSSANTRVFPQLEFGPNVTSPAMTVLGGADDNRWASSPMRRAVGEITRRIGADAALMVDASFSLSPREEGTIIAGILDGGTRRVVVEGTYTLIRNDGTILSVESFHASSDATVSGSTTVSSRKNTYGGLARFEPNFDNLNDLTMQAVRNAADMIASRYQDYVQRFASEK